ncbi:MAG: maleylacetate reductase [Roseiflexaceae bacterium]|nr:maleylacetate reductase [Roseiflexaceae bacterium]
MKPFTYDALPGRVVFGAGSSRSQLGPEIDRMGVQRVLLLVSERERPGAEVLTQPFGERVVGIFSAVRPHVPIEVAEQARTMARDLQADSILAIGGGSAIGTAKAIALELNLPIIAIPTTYAGSEMTPIYGLTTMQRKQTGRSLAVLPKLVLYDPELTFSLPAHISGPSAINAIAHCVEAFYGPGANPISSLIAEEGLRALADGVPVVVAQPNDLAGRTTTLYGAYLAGAALAAAGTGLHHKICHVLGGAYNLPHADLHTVMLPQVVAFLEPAIPAIMRRMGRALRANEQTTAAALHDLAVRIGAPTALKEIGMCAEDLEPAVTRILEYVPHDPVRPINTTNIRAILDSAFLGHSPPIEVHEA